MFLYRICYCSNVGCGHFVVATKQICQASGVFPRAAVKTNAIPVRLIYRIYYDVQTNKRASECYE